MNLLLLIVALVALSAVNAAYCNGSPADGERTNDATIAPQNLVLIKKVKNGVLYEAGPDNARFPVVHVYGTPYEMGYAQGQLVTRQLTEFVHGTFDYITGAAADSLPDKYPQIPDFMKKVILEKGINAALDLTATLTKPFTPDAFFQELQGIADACPDVKYEMLLRLQMFPEVTKASCSFFGAYGDAAQDGKTIHMRSLDYDTDGPFKDHPQLTIYHPSEGNTFANMGWPGSIGTLTGMNALQMSINEIGVSYPDDSFGQGTPDTPPEKLAGTPWMLVVRNILQHTTSLTEAVSSVEQAERTCNLILGVGDGKAQMVNGIEYSGRVAVPYNDLNMLPINATWHPVVKNAVYNGMDWLCPGYTQKLGDQLAKYRTIIAPSNVIGNVLPTVQTGNLHIALYDLTDDEMYVSFCRSSTAPTTEPMYAYERQFTKLHMKDLWNEPLPAVLSE